MAIYFGTDGIRGVVNNFLTQSLAYKCGNSLARFNCNLKSNNKTSPTKILIGGDTRLSRTFLTCAFASGAISAGAHVVDVGICPTAGIAYLTKTLKFDFGVVISASHNSFEYNGIKIFNNQGVKLNDSQEEDLEKLFSSQINLPTEMLGSYTQKFSLTKKYQEYLISCCNTSLKGLTILLDCANGASYKIAPNVFKKLGAKVISSSSKNCGLKINKNCGSTFSQNIKNLAKKYAADMAFAFDGDADRIIACDEVGNILDGDIILFMLSKFLKKSVKLLKNTVVCTTHTNKGIEKDLNKLGIKLIRTDIGDKYVINKIETKNLSLGGEKSGHIIFRQYSTTGDGILAAVKLAQMAKIFNKKFSELSFCNLYPQINIDCVVKDQIKVINSQKLFKQIKTQQDKLGSDARVMVRYSGTEPKIRIMVESINYKQAQQSAEQLKKTVIEIDKNIDAVEVNKCVEL